MNWRTVTKWFAWSAFGVIIIYDLFASRHRGASISSEFLHTAGQYPVLPFAWGVLSGHLFVPQYIDKT